MEEETRGSAIKRYLSKPPRGAAVLVLLAAAQGTDTTRELLMWPIEDVKPELAAEVLGTLDDHARELNASVMAELRYRNGEGSYFGPVKVIMRANPKAGVPELASGPAELTGDMTSQAQQAQRHLEVMGKLYLGHIQQLFLLQRQAQEHTMELCDALAQRLVDAEHRERRVAQERDELREAIDTTVASASEDEATANAQNAITRSLEPFLPAIVQAVVRSLASGGVPPAPPTPQA